MSTGDQVVENRRKGKKSKIMDNVKRLKKTKKQKSRGLLDKKKIKGRNEREKAKRNKYIELKMKGKPTRR